MNSMEGIKERCFSFALRVIKLYSSVKSDDAGRIIGKQVLRSGTSIGANIEEAYAGQSRKDFIHKFTIAQKEAHETNYWLRILRDSEIISANTMSSIITESDELVKIISQSIITAKKSLKK